MQSLKSIASTRIVHCTASSSKITSAYYSSISTVCTSPKKLFLKPFVRQNLKYNFSYQAFEMDVTLTLSQQINMLSELNQASLKTLQEYGLDLSTATALEECRPFTHISQLESVAGIGKEMLLQVHKKYSQASQLRLQPLWPRLSMPEPPESIVAVTINSGCICYCHLSLSDLVQSLSDGTPPAVKLLDVDLLSIVTSDSRLHPHKLLTKIETTLCMVPSADIYVMPNTHYNTFLQNASPGEINMKKQFAQITGMVQGQLAMAPSACSPPLYLLRDSFVHSLFQLKVIGNAVTSSLSLLHSLLRGEQQQQTAGSSVEIPRLVMSQETYSQCMGRSENDQLTLAPTVYSSLAFCALLHNAFRSP